MTALRGKSLLIAIGGAKLFGAERRVIRLATTIARLKPDLNVVLALAPGLYAAAMENEGIGAHVRAFEARKALVVYPEIQPFSMGRHLGLLASHLLKGTPVFTSYGTDRFMLGLRLLGIRFTYEVTSPAVVDRIAQRKRTWLAKATKSFLCVSPSVATKLIKYFASEKIDIAPKVSAYPSPFLDPNVFQDEPKSDVIVIGSRFAQRKNVHIFAKALVLALPQLPGWKVKICGQGPYEAEIRETLKDFIASGAVTVQYVPSLATELRSSKVFVSVIEADNYPSQSVIEAMGCGNALLLSNRGDSHRFIDEHGANGALVDISPDAIAHALLQLCQSEHLDAMASASRRHLEVLCDEQRYVDAMLASCDLGTGDHGN